MTARKTAPAKPTPAKAAPAKPTHAKTGRRPARTNPAVEIAASVVGLLTAHLTGRKLDADQWRQQALDRADETWQALERTRDTLNALASAIATIEAGGNVVDLDEKLAAYTDAARTLAERL